ncbi:hypothetical protein ACE1N8_12565 [Streptomyces sp. DSM 116494]|uniref:hypothetical protein n=1 Tax=Streptomyces okerensis TaxID=3344655 RepID=UPI0038905DC3
MKTGPGAAAHPPRPERTSGGNPHERREPHDPHKLHKSYELHELHELHELYELYERHVSTRRRHLRRSSRS